jgi:hypothetical protein
MEAASDHLDQVVEQGTSCTKKLEEQCAGTKTIMEEAGRILLEATADLTTTIQETQDRKVDERTTTLTYGTHGGDATEEGRKTYAEAMKASPAAHINAITRTEVLRRQP